MINREFKKLTALLAMGTALILTMNANAYGASAYIKVGKQTSQPIGHYEFCAQYPSECKVRARNIKPTKLTRKRWAELAEVNAYSNTRVAPVTDEDYYGVPELWAFPDRFGDCEDYALMKRHMLMSKGWPASSLLITVVRQTNGDGHAVLTVRTDRGDYILDNLNDKIEIWHDSEYTFLKRQMPAHSGRWQDLIDTRTFVGSVK